MHRPKRWLSLKMACCTPSRWRERDRSGKTDAEDKALEGELLADKKELAEHNMLVDLGRNDLGKISKFGTVKVETPAFRSSASPT